MAMKKKELMDISKVKTDYEDYEERRKKRKRRNERNQLIEISNNNLIFLYINIIIRIL